MTMKTTRKAFIVASLACGLALGGAPLTAYADWEEYAAEVAAESTADLIAELAPDAGEVIKPDVVGGEITATMSEVEITVPMGFNEAITIEPKDASLAMEIEKDFCD